MALKSEASLTVGLASGALVVAIFNGATPNIVDGRSAKPGDPDYSASIKLAGWSSIAAVAIVSLLAKDPTVFVIGGTVATGLILWHRHANLVDPAVARASALFNMESQGAPTEASDPGDYGYADSFAVGA